MREELEDYFICKERLKNEFEEINGFDFYRFIFPNCEDIGELNQDFSKPNPVYLFRDYETKKINRRIMLKNSFERDYVNFIERNDLALCSGLAYRGRTNQLQHAQHMNALIFDLDGVGIDELEHFLSVLEDVVENPKYAFKIPRPTFLVLSGTGMHVYYVFKEPVELYPNIKNQLKGLKYDLTTYKIWRWRETSKQKEIQYQSINQAFRMVGSINEKHGNEIIAFKIGDKINLDYLNKFVVHDKNKVDINKRFRPTKHTLEEARMKFPEWYENTIEKGIKSKKKWHIKKDLYEWWKNRCKEVKGGHRYFYLMCMAIYAYKCDVGKKELEKDMYEAFEELKKTPHVNKLTEADVKSALESYDKGYYNFTINDIEHLTALRINRNKRNGRSQDLHLKGTRALQEIYNPNWRDGNGRPTKEELIKEWRRQNPNGKKIDCERETGLSRHTVLKWW